LTFPTKRFHVDKAPGNPSQLGDVAPFTDTWTKDAPGGCEVFAFDFWDREEGQLAPGGPIVSPRPPTPQGFQLCREANVIRFGHSDGPDNTEILKEVQRSGALG